MNSLITVSKMTSMQIAEVTNKRHADIMRDIRDEAERLENGGIRTERKFALSERQDSTGRTIPYYELTKEGVLQLAARYDAVTRAKLIELAIQQDKPKSALEALVQTVQALQEQERRMTQIETTQQAIKDAVISEPDNWREDINRKMNKIAEAIGLNKYREVRAESYKLLEQRAGVKLERRLDNKKARLLKEGASRTAIKNTRKIDIIDEDKKLREIYGKIVSEYMIKYTA
jgi:phage regulator Rha-like protein